MRNLSLSAALALACTSGAHASTLLTPTAVNLNTGTQFFSIGNVIDNSGLSGAATSANYTSITHAGASGTTAWTTDGPAADYYTAAPAPVMTLDLGGTYHVSDLVLWGYHFGSPNNNEAKTFQVEFSTDGVNFGDAVMVDHRRTAQFGETLSLGGSHEASQVRLTITDNHFGAAGAAGGDRVGLGEVKFLGSDRPLVNASAGATYSYTTLPTFSGGTFYLDDPHPGYATAGDYGVGDLNDGVTHPNGSAPTTGPVNSIVGWGDPASIATDITFDLGDTFYVPEQIVLGSHLWAAFANGAPDSVTVRSSMDGSIFTDLTTATLGAPAGDGHWDLAVPIEGASAARFVQLSFDGGAVLTGNTPNKWMLDEITILASVPEPSRAMLLLLGVAGFALRRRR